MELKFLRQAARLTQQQLADLAGLDNSTISAIEAGRRDLAGMSYINVVRLAKALNVPPHALVPTPDDTPATPEPEPESRPA